MKLACDGFVSKITASRFPTGSASDIVVAVMTTNVFYGPRLNDPSSPFMHLTSGFASGPDAQFLTILHHHVPKTKVSEMKSKQTLLNFYSLSVIEGAPATSQNLVAGNSNIRSRN